jgi:hypothetical protein
VAGPPLFGGNLPHGDSFPPIAPEAAPDLSASEERVIAWRAAQFESAGLDSVHADMVASLRSPLGGFVVDVGRFRHLIAHGCSPALAVEILS